MPREELQPLAGKSTIQSFLTALQRNYRERKIVTFSNIYFMGQCPYFPLYSVNIVTGTVIAPYIASRYIHTQTECNVFFPSLPPGKI